LPVRSLFKSEKETRPLSSRAEAVLASNVLPLAAQKRLSFQRANLQESDEQKKPFADSVTSDEQRGHLPIAFRQKR